MKPEIFFVIKRILFLAVFCFSVLGAGHPALAAGVIRDAEIEHVIRRIATPLFKAGHIAPERVKILLLNSPQINAFVAEGDRLFIHSGLFLTFPKADQLAGVIAHETGHLQGGHLVRLHGRMKKAKQQTLLSTILGGAAAFATGRADVGIALAAGGVGTSARSFYSYTRSEENSADQAAMSILDKVCLSPRGYLSVMRKLEQKTMLEARQQDVYMQTHPFVRERLSFVENYLSSARCQAMTLTPEIQDAYRRARLKLQAFIEEPARMLAILAEEEDVPAVLYARAIALYRQGEMEKGDAIMEGLFKKEPENPYFYELHAQMLFENGQAAEAVAPYEKAWLLSEKDYLIAIPYARALIETQEAEALKKAISILKEAVDVDRENAIAWQNYALALGGAEQEGEAAYAMAEYYFLIGKNDDALHQARKAKHKLPETMAVLRLRVDDIIQALTKTEKKSP